MKIRVSPKNNLEKNKSYIIASIIFSFFIGQLSYAQIGTWTKVRNLAPNDNMGVMLLLTDGTVICHNATGGAYGYGWDKLTPSDSGSYANGIWTSIASMHQERLFFASQVLPNGKVFVAGGEYGAGDTAGEVYDPATNIWTSTGGVISQQNIYDGNSEILPNGNILVGVQNGLHPSYDNLYYMPSTNSWSTAQSCPYPYNHDESAWLKLPDSSILFVGIASRKSCRFIPRTNTWVVDGTLPVSLYDVYGEESGTATLLPNGKGLFLGAQGPNAIYTPSGNNTPGTWTAAASFPIIGGSQTGQTDAPSAMMVNGHILCAVSPIGLSNNDEFIAPVYFLEYDYITNTFTQVTSIIPGLATDSLGGVSCFQANMLTLPDGNVLVSIDQANISNQYYIYTPGSAPIQQGKPTINNILPDGCPDYKITGKLFNGISEGAAYGDDWQMSTNYPLVRLTKGVNVFYAKTTNWNRIGAVQTDSLEDTAIFTLPAGLSPGTTYSLVVVANGFASNPTLFTTLGITVASQTNSSCGGNTGSITANAAIGGTPPYTYSWTPSGGTNITASGLSAGTYTVTVTDNNGCKATVSTSITQSAVLNISFHQINVSCNGGNNGSISATPSGGAIPYTYSWSGGGNSASKLGLTAGSYTLTVYDNNGCMGTATINVTQPPALVLTTDYIDSDSTGAEPCNGEASIIVSGGNAPYHYSWSPGNGTNDTINGKCSGYYCCTITDNNGCTQTACVNIKNITGISPVNNSSNINIYPNPNMGSFIISGIIEGQIVELYNSLGQKLGSVIANKTTMDFDIANRADGIYLIRILNKDGNLEKQQKIIKAQ